MKFNDPKKIYRGIAILLTVFILFVATFVISTQKAHAQSGGSLWKMSSNLLLPVNSVWNLKIPGLNNTGTTRCINVLSNGTFEVADDECGTGGGGGGVVDLGDTSDVDFTPVTGGSVTLNFPYRAADGSLDTLTDDVFYTDGSDNIFVYDIYWFFKDIANGLFKFDVGEVPSGETVTGKIGDVFTGTSGSEYITFGSGTAGNCTEWISAYVVGDTGSPCGAGGSIDGSGTTNEITYWVDSDTVGSLATAIYPSLSELAFGKGVTSSIQTQLNAKAPIASPTFTGTVSVPSTNFTVGTSLPFSDSAGTLTLGNIDLLDATTEATIESAIDTLANLVSIQGRTVTLADAGADAIFGWDDSANAYQNLSASDVRTAAGVVIGTDVLSFSAYDDATSGEVNTGTSTAKYVSPDSLAGSNYGTRGFTISINGATALTTGDGKAYVRIPEEFNGFNLVGVRFARLSGTGTPLVQVHNLTQTADMLTTRVSIDSGETDSSTAATAVVIDTANDDVASADRLRIDVDDAGTATLWAEVQLVFRLP